MIHLLRQLVSVVVHVSYPQWKEDSLRLLLRTCDEYVNVVGMNRHHFSVYVHNCRLVMLLRQEPGPNVDLNVFKPAEWRWRLDQVCDGTWHHYAISVDFPEVLRLSCLVLGH